MKKIKILHIGLSSNLGGIEKYLINMHRNINHNKFQLDYLVSKGKEVCFAEEFSEKSCIYKITSRKQNYIKYLKELREFFKKSNYDYIHFHLMDFSCSERIYYAKKYTNAQLILHSHIANNCCLNIKTKLLNAIGEKIVRRYDKYLKVACSKCAGEDMFKNFPNQKFKVLNNGINIEEFKFNEKDRNAIREKLHIEGKFVIGNVGRLVKQKNQMFLLEIFKEVQKQNKNSSLIIIGNGKMKDKLVEKADILGIKDEVIYVDCTNEVNKYMGAMDAFVFPSINEGLGIVLIEAQASGLKCFITSTLPEELNISDQIIRIPIDKPAKHWADKIINATKNEEDRLVVNEKIEKTIFNVKTSVETIEKYYMENLKT